jgi:putative endonuclease
MDKRKNLGKLGEDMAVDYLLKNQFNVLHRNWRYGKKEIDIIAERAKKLHFIEIKTRRTNRYGYPVDNVSRAKIRNMMTVACHYQQLYPEYQYIQFDVISITLEPKLTFFYIEDVYI